MNVNNAAVGGAFAVLTVALVERIFNIQVGEESAAALATVYIWAGAYLGAGMEKIVVLLEGKDNESDLSKSPPSGMGREESP